MKYFKNTLPLLASVMVLFACANDPRPPESLGEASLQGPSLVNTLQGQVIDLSKPIDADGLAVIAIYTNPDLKSLRANIGIAEAQAFAAGLFPDPVFSFGIDVPLNGTGLVSALGAGLGYDFGALARRPSLIRGAQANLDKVRLDIAWAEWLTAQQARLLFTRVNHLRRIKVQTSSFRGKADSELTKALRAASRGDLPAAALETRRIAATDAADRDRNIELQLKSSELDLNRLLGIDPSEVLMLALLPVVGLKIPSTETLFHHAVLARADLAGMRAGYEALKAQTAAAELGRFPLPTIGLNATRDTGKIKTLGPNVSFTLPLWNRGRGDTAIAVATEAQLRAEYSARLEMIRADIAASTASMVITKAQIIDINRDISPLFKQSNANDHAAARGDIAQSTAQTAHMTLLDKQISVALLALTLAELEVVLEVSVGLSLESI